MEKSMKMILKRFTVTVIAAALAFPLAACSEEGENQEAETRYVFHEKFALAEDRMMNEDGVYSLKDNKLYYITQGDDDDSLDMYNQYVNMCNLSDGTVSELFPVTPDDSKPEDGGSVSASVEAIKAEDNEDITVIMDISTYDDMGDDLGKALKKYTYSSEGKMKDVCDIDISGPDQDEDYYIASCRLSRQGEIYVLLDIIDESEETRGRLCKCNPDGSQAANFMLDERGIAVKDIIFDGNDMPVAIFDKDSEDPDTYRICTMAAYFDMDKGMLGAGLDGIASGKDDIFRELSVYSGGSDSAFLINDKISLSEYDVSTGVEQVVCNWMDCGLAGAYVIYAVKCGNGNIFCLYNNGYTQGVSEQVIAGFIEKTDTVDDRPVIRVASCFGKNGLQQAILKINRENEKYRVEYVSYEQYGGTIEKTVEKLNYEIMAGNVPDVIILDDQIMDINNYIAKGFLEDLTPYIEKDSVLNKDYFLDGFLDAIRIDGKIYFLGDSFTIDTLVGKKSELSKYENGWTTDAFMEYYKSKPEGTDIFANTTKQGVCHALIAQNMTKFIDWNTGRCIFDGEEFKKLLEFCNGFEENGKMISNAEYEMADHIKPIKEGKLLFQIARVYDVQSIQIYQTLFGNDEMYIGYPSDNNNGTYLNLIDGMVGIFASSEHKDEAWDFIKALFDSEYIKDSYDFNMSSSKEGFEKHFTKSSGYDQYGMGNGISFGPARKEDAEAVKELVKKSTYRYYLLEQYGIIEEDINSYFKGEKGIDETVKIIQDRMDKYVNENR